MMKKYLQSHAVFMPLVLIHAGQVAAADYFNPGPAPAQLLRPAMVEMAKLKGTSPEQVLTDYVVTWEYEGWYDDDQPADFFFRNSNETCLIAVGSQSHAVRESLCTPHAG